MSSSQRSDGEAERRDPTLAGRLTRHDAHPFQTSAGDAGGDVCAFCGERRAQIRHHPTRVRAACLLKGLDANLLLRGSGR